MGSGVYLRSGKTRNEIWQSMEFGKNSTYRQKHETDAEKK